MPRTPIDLGLALEQLSILDEDGNMDASLDPKVAPKDLRRLYRCLLLVRAYDERRLRLQRQGRIGTFAPVQGQEAAQLGSVFAIEAADWVVPSFREIAVAIWRGLRLEDDLLFCAGFDEGLRIPEGAHDLPICIPVASQIPHAVGLAWGLKLQGSDRVVLCYFGDGATSEGDFHEALNFASLHQVPIVLFCQNNQWAISVPRKEQTRSRTLAQKGFAYEIPSVIVDGNDLLAVIAATQDAVARARQGRGPTFIEAVTYRMGVHTTADDPTLYRGSAEVAAWAQRDPLRRLHAYLTREGIVTQEEEDAWIEEARQGVDDAVYAFEEAASALDPLGMFDHLYAAPPAPLEEQRRELVGRISRRPMRPPEPEEGEAGARGGERGPQAPSAQEEEAPAEEEESPAREEQTSGGPEEGAPEEAATREDKPDRRRPSSQRRRAKAAASGPKERPARQEDAP